MLSKARLKELNIECQKFQKVLKGGGAQWSRPLGLPLIFLSGTAGDHLLKCIALIFEGIFHRSQ